MATTVSGTRDTLLKRDFILTHEMVQYAVVFSIKTWLQVTLIVE